MTTYATTITYTNYTVTKVTYTNYTLVTITTLVTYVNKTVITVAGENQTETNATFTNTKLIVSVGDYIASKGDQILIDVVINDSRTIAGGHIELHFNSSIVTVDSVLGGDFGQPIVNINNVGGVIGIAAASPTPVEKSLAVLAKIRFTCHRQGYTRLMITSAELNDVHGRIIIPKVSDGSITITSFLKGDLNGNGRLDTGDVTLILRMIVGLEPVNLLGDMNGNGRIDTGDATLLLRKIVGLE